MDLGDILRKEGNVIKDAPVSFCVCVLLLCGAIFGAVNWIYSGTLNAKDATIETLQAALAHTQGDDMEKLPIVDPKIKGKLWSNGGVLCVSEG